jgi:hypothetical protein
VGSCSLLRAYPCRFTACISPSTTAIIPPVLTGAAGAAESGAKKQAFVWYCRVASRCWRFIAGLCSIGSISPGAPPGRPARLPTDGRNPAEIAGVQAGDPWAEIMVANGFKDVELVDLHPVQFYCSMTMSGLPHHGAGVFVVAEADELCVAQMISARPLQELDLCHRPGLHPDAFLHLLGS